MKRLVVIASVSLLFVGAGLLLVPSPRLPKSYASGTWSVVQWLTPTRNTCNPGGGPPLSDYLECTEELASALTTGNQATILFVNNNDMPNQTPRQIALAYACPTPGGVNTDCNPTNNTETINLHHSPGDDCRGAATAISGGTTSTDAATIQAASASAARWITVWRTDNGQLETMGFAVGESNTTVGSAHVSSCVGAGVNAVVQSAIVTPGTVGANAAIFMGLSSRPTAVSSPYASNVFIDAHFLYTYAINQGSAAPATVTVSPPPGYTVASSMVAWAEGPQVIPLGSVLTGHSVITSKSVIR